MQNILVTGGAGFIGCHLIDRLLAEGHSVVCFDNFDNFYNPIMKWGNVTHHAKNKSFKLVSGLVNDMRSFKKAFSNGLNAVVHLAAQAGVRPSMQNPVLHSEVNVSGTINMLELCRTYGIKKVVFASSSSVYGNHDTVPFQEDANVDKPLCPYAASKKAGELICYTYHHLYGMDISCIRPFTVYGSRQRLEMAIPLFTRLIFEGKPLTIYGEGNTKRDYTHVSDVVDGIMRILYVNAGYQIYNLGTGEVTMLNHLIQMISEHLGKRTMPDLHYEPRGIGEAIITHANIEKAKRMLGYSPKMKIYDGLKEYVDWFLEEVRKNAI